MVKKTIILTSLLLSGLTYANDYQGQTTEPIGSLHPVEVVCKTARNYSPYLRLSLPTGYAVVGETHSGSCAGGGNNAWLAKILESGDTICSAPHNDTNFPYFIGYNSFSISGYNIINQSYSNNCPHDYTTDANAKRVRKAYNTVTLQAIKVANNCIGTPDYVNWIFSNAEICSSFIMATEPSLTSCSQSAIGYATTSSGYTVNCDPTKGSSGTFPDNTYFHQLVQNDVAYQVHTMNYIVNSVWISSTHGKKLSKTLKENICHYSLLPYEYRVISSQFSKECYHNEWTTYNQSTIKKLTDDEEYFCITAHPNAIHPGLTTYIPNDYVFTEQYHEPKCYFTDTNEINAYKIRKLKSNDTVCKAYFYSGDRLNNQSPSPFYGEDDYGIIGETTLESCGNTNNNAYFIKKLSKTDTVCEAWFYHEYYPDYVIDSVGHMPSCPGTGNNAYNLRQINEPEDVICTYAPYSNYYYSFNNNGFEIIGLEDKTQCGHLQGFRIRLR